MWFYSTCCRYVYKVESKGGEVKTFESRTKNFAKRRKKKDYVISPKCEFISGDLSDEELSWLYALLFGPACSFLDCTHISTFEPYGLLQLSAIMLNNFLGISNQTPYLIYRG